MNKELNKIMRGEVYYVYPNAPVVGSEQRSGRPAVIVSNNVGNENASVVEVCYLTLQDKPNLPTHVFIPSGRCGDSTILCEQITTVSKLRIGDYMCRLSDNIMDEVDRALAVSLALPDFPTAVANLKKVSETSSNEATEEVETEEATSAESHDSVLDESPAKKESPLKKLKQELEDSKSFNKTLVENNQVLCDKASNLEAENTRLKEQLEITMSDSILYKRMYDELIDKLLRRG